MAEKFFFLVLSSSGDFIKRAHCSRWTLYCLFSALILLMAVIAVGAADYIKISRKVLAQNKREDELVLKSRELVQYRRQIQKFAREINRLKGRIVELNQMDLQIRRVAGMKESTALFGIGGAAPEDLDPGMKPERNYNRLMIKMHRQVDELKNAAFYQRNSLKDVWKVVEERGDFMAYTPTIRPAEGWISSPFGYRQSPFTGKREFHEGLDIASSRHTQIFATADGRIAFAGKRRGFGRLVLIDHGHGLKTLYAHLERILKKPGDAVKRGDIIAYMGSTGRSTGIHLHYEVRLNGVPVNPQKYIFN